ncbi:MAG: hypothetical protein JJT85_09480 [Chromatiales bacterium]|nr:hypothetical protein [Chromatiales bacterium]
MRKTRLITTMAAGLMASAAHSATVTLCGPTICYEYDEAQAAIELFGAPELIGDGLRFLPASFLALSANGAGIDVANATFQISRVWTPGGQNIIGLEVIESGDLEIINGGSVSAGLFVQLASNVSLFDVNTDTDSLALSGSTGGLQEWTLSTVTDPSAVFLGPANDFSLVIQNFLTANTSESGDLAWIQKKLMLEIAVIPIPAAVWLFASALGLLAWVRRRAVL